MNTCLKWTEFYAPSTYFTYVRRTPPFFHGNRKRKPSFKKKLFIFNTLKLSFPTKVISIVLSNPTPIPLFILVPVALQLAHGPGKQRNLFNVFLRKSGTCPTTSSRLKWPIATMAAAYSSYSLLSSLLQNKGQSIKYARKIFRKTNISNPLIRTCT